MNWTENMVDMISDYLGEICI